MDSSDLKEYYAVILGALLHDVGKFVQRSQKNPKSQNHSQWGEEWFQENLAEKLTPLFSERKKQIIRSAISNHHGHEQYISLADAISAGMDRIKLETEEEGDPFTDRLISIFSWISISDKLKKEKYHKLFPLGKDNLKETFPIDNKKCAFEEYAELLKGFENEIHSTNFINLSRQEIINVLYFLLWKYAWCIPGAAYKDEPDVSLFDHLKTTAAITGCLYAYHKENIDKQLDFESDAFCLIGGDISGIQNYIFDVITQQGKVAKRLRARSLFVQLISEIASHKILHAFNLPLCNLIGAAGGNFYILVPNLKETDNRIIEMQREFDEWTLAHLKAELAISLANVKLCGRDMADFSKILEELKPALNFRKYQPHNSALSAGGKWIEKEFLRSEVIEGDEKACQGCRKNPQVESENNVDNLCDRCMTDIKIGQALPKTKYIAFFNDNSHKYEILNYSFELWNENDFKNTSTKEPYLILSLNIPEVRLPVTGFKYLATHIPVDENENQPATFDYIANISDGDKLLGYVKADVDNLGEILREGFKKTKPSISRFSTFSQMLEIFFAGYLNVKLKNDFKDTYTVFSGGDDFFLIGPWNQTIDFAYLMRKEFTGFCAENPDMKFSCGVIFSKPHEPLSYCAKRVEEKLKASKSLQDKDRITLFDQTVRWVDMERILNEARRVTAWLTNQPPIISRGLVYNLREYGDMAIKSGIVFNASEIKTQYLGFVPLLTNDINRNLSKPEQQEAYAWAEDLRVTTSKPKGGENLPYLRAIIEYVLTFTRGD